MTRKRRTVYDKYGGRCAYCGCDISSYFEVDHIIPTSIFEISIKYSHNIPPFLTHLKEEDRNHPDNLTPACLSCNAKKSKKDLATFRAYLEKKSGCPVKFYFELLKESNLHENLIEYHVRFRTPVYYMPFSYSLLK